MSSAALQSYLAGIDPVAAPVVLALDAAIRTAQPDLDVAVKYRIVTYALQRLAHLGFEDVVDPAAVGAYVTEAVGRYSEYKANAQEVLDASRAAATARRPPMAGS